ncbi:MAG: hypothetical protein CMM01_07095 [Rhodopirellula sp.]|nr:hypothetical protein [Rhodopirellula sp.]OUX51795.1 MAG: hypothetical protein CBE43_02455 [Rhodopirellula sp. TMED283]
MSGDLNPFAPPETKPELPEALKPAIGTEKPRSLPWIACRWLLVCSVSAVPSFYLGVGVSDGQIAAMGLGVLFFAVGYTFLDCKTATRPIRQIRLVSITLRLVYATRMIITVLFPIGLFVDMFCGILSVGCTESIFGSSVIKTFPGALFTTLVQGVILNVVLVLYGLLVVGAVMLFVPCFRAARTWLYGPPD